jgi:hypothetical protein
MLVVEAPQFQKFELLVLSIFWLAIIYHGLGKQRLNQLVDVVVWLEHLVPWDSIVVDDARLVQSVLHFFGQLLTKVQRPLQLLDHIRIILGLVFDDGPVEANVAGSLMSQFQCAACFLVGRSSQNEERLLGFLQESVLLLDKGIVNVSLSREINILLHVLVEHDVAHVLNIIELQLLEEFDQFRDVFFLDPDEQQAIFHHVHGNFQA